MEVYFSKREEGCQREKELLYFCGRMAKEVRIYLEEWNEKQIDEEGILVEGEDAWFSMLSEMYDYFDAERANYTETGTESVFHTYDNIVERVHREMMLMVGRLRQGDKFKKEVKYKYICEE